MKKLIFALFNILLTFFKKNKKMATAQAILGIENLKLILKALSDTAQKAYNLDADKNNKIDLSEGVQFSGFLFSALISAYPAFAPAAKEVRDLSSSEIDELIEYIIALPILPYDKKEAEQFLDRTLITINILRLYIIDLISKLRPSPAA